MDTIFAIFSKPFSNLQSNTSSPSQQQSVNLTIQSRRTPDFSYSPTIIPRRSRHDLSNGWSVSEPRRTSDASLSSTASLQSSSDNLILQCSTPASTSNRHSNSIVSSSASSMLSFDLDSDSSSEESYVSFPCFENLDECVWIDDANYGHRKNLIGTELEMERYDEMFVGNSRISYS
ncbi:hypothetical protein G9A89_001566 [Geosiphon pyriformis]|nr:hypothetical protein G9A89_001566 [Geosiphon pyriformis]